MVPESPDHFLQPRRVCGGRGQEEFKLISPILNPGALFHSKAMVYSLALANPFIQGFLKSLRLPIQPVNAFS